jgi:hypothetical protein
MRTLLILLAATALPACDDGATTDSDDPGTDAEFVTCEGKVCRVTDDILADYTLTADKTWILEGAIFVGDDADACPTLTVEPGTTIYGATGRRSFLSVQRCADLHAVGTVEEPIVFTSAKEPGQRKAEDWGGIILNGRALNNLCAQGVDCDIEGEGSTGYFGGDDPTDSCGTLTYVRVEFAGELISDDNQLNGVAFQACGSGTTVDYLQVHHNADDGVEFFGGSVDASHLVLTGIGDDSIDWTNGWTGSVQYAVVQQWPGRGDNGIEADNNEDDNAKQPRSLPTLSNLTVIGSPDSEKSDIGMLLRRGTGAIIKDSIVGGFNDTCLSIDGAETFNNAWDGELLTGQLTIANSFVGQCGQLYKDKDAQGFTTEQWVETHNQGNSVIDDLSEIVQAPFATDAPDWRSKGAAAGVGAITGEDWTKGWTTSAAN